MVKGKHKSDFVNGKKENSEVRDQWNQKSELG
jgi:hypothetical protein